MLFGNDTFRWLKASHVTAPAGAQRRPGNQGRNDFTALNGRNESDSILTINPTRNVRPTVWNSSRKTGGTRFDNLPVHDAPAGDGYIRARFQRALD